MIEPLRLSFTVACSQAHAFAIWTTRTALWWPATQTVSGERGAELRIEPGIGGRVFERMVSGREVEWGEVTAWEPPQRLAYLWHIMTDRASATDVEVTFTALPDGTTRVEITQTGWERLGEAGPGWRDANRGGWSVAIPLYTAACADVAATSP